MNMDDDVTSSDNSLWSKLTVRRVLALCVAILAVAFIAQNTGRVPINLLWGGVIWPMWLALTLVFLAGAIVGILIARGRAARRSRIG
jgi:uncharacterized integral membrane protein